MNQFPLPIFLLLTLGSVDIAMAEVIETPSTETRITHTTEIQTQARLWRIDESEYRRYLELMQGPLGKWSPDIDPLLALGMFADSPQQEQRYAELYAQQEFDLTERALRFQHAYRDAFNRLYPDVGILDQRLLAPYFNNQQQQDDARVAKRLAQKRFVDGDRLLVFMSPSCDQCASTLSHLMSLLSGINNGGVDIYVLEAQSDEDVRHWASMHNIQHDWLDEQRLTLNRDEGLFQQLASRSSVLISSSTPVFLHRNDRFFQLNPGDLGL